MKLWNCNIKSSFPERCFPLPKLCLSALLANCAYFAAPAYTAVVGFEGNPTANSGDWTTFVTSTGALINGDVNFDTHPSGLLQPNFYLGSDGVTLNATGYANVATGTGAPSGGLTPPLSPGEGPLGTASYLEMQATTLIVSFATPVEGVGFYTADLYNPNNDNLILSIYSGPNATGTLLGQFIPPAFNFQLNNLYFIGAADIGNTIGSAVLNAVGQYGDGIELDKIVFSQVPEPASPLLAFTAILFVKIRVRIPRGVMR